MKKKLVKELQDSYKLCYTNISQILNSSTLSDNEKILNLKHISYLIKNDIKYDYLSRLLYTKLMKKEHLEQKHKLQNNYSVLTSRFITEDFKEINLKEDICISCPYIFSKFTSNNITIKNKGFVYHNNNHYAYYYTGIDITIIINGFHSCSSGILQGGKILARVVDVLYDDIEVNNSGEYTTCNGDVLGRDFDIRFTILYKLNKEILKLNKEK